MKNILKFAAALAVMVTVSCNKEMNPSEGVSPEGNTVKVTMNATTADQFSKVTLNGKRFEWEVGDQLQTTYYTGSPLTAISAGSVLHLKGKPLAFQRLREICMFFILSVEQSVELIVQRRYHRYNQACRQI